MKDYDENFIKNYDEDSTTGYILEVEKNCLLNNEVIIKSQQRFKSAAHNVDTEEFNKVA